MRTLAAAAWPVRHVADAISALGQAAGIPVRAVDPLGARGEPAPHQMERWVVRSATWLGVEAEATDTAYRQLDEMVLGAGPALLRVELLDPGGVGFLALLRANPRTSVLIGPGGLVKVRTAKLREAIARPVIAPAVASVERMLDLARVDASARERVRSAVLRERLGAARVGGFWILRRPATAPLFDQLRSAGAVGAGASLILAHALRYAASLASWWTIGRGALQGHLDAGWIVAWAVLLLTQVPLHLLELRAQGRLTIEGAGVLKRRLMQGALALAPEEMRGEGAGQLLGRTMEANALEALATAGGFAAVTAAMDLASSAVVLALAGGPLPCAALIAWIGLGAWIARSYQRSRASWTDRRLALTHGLVERMVGHRTRIAQQPSSERHSGEDEELSRYFEGSRGMDDRSVALTALLPGGWMLVGLASLTPMLVSASSSPSTIAVAIGGVLLAFAALRRLAGGARGLVAAFIAWRRVAPLFEAGGRVERPSAPELSAQGERSRTLQPEANRPVLTAHELVFRYRANAEPALRGCSLRIAAGDRVLLEGPSGGGKSTLSLLLAGVRAPESGTLLAGALDRHTLGSHDWRKRILAVPQFHENHVVSSTFGFNLLMGREWPPRNEDLVEAERVCRELGLGQLLDRMPSGLQQMVGETGWQLSHGERGRLYIARALLQDPEVLILDETFAALDPETMQVALGCVLKRAPALVVVAHP